MEFKQFKLPAIETDYFSMHPLELKEYMDFEVKRLYYITDVTWQTSQHCHKEEKELFILVKGFCTAIIDTGNGKQLIEFVNGNALYVPNYVWHGFSEFSWDATLIALSSTSYKKDRSDYIEDYKEFQQIHNERRTQKTIHQGI